jgi:hypothetical protein
MAGIRRLFRKSRQNGDCVVADAVRVEPVSAAKFPTTGKLIGNFAEKGRSPPITMPFPPFFQCVEAKFPIHWKWEFCPLIWETAEESALP